MVYGNKHDLYTGHCSLSHAFPNNILKTWPVPPLSPLPPSSPSSLKHYAPRLVVVPNVWSFHSSGSSIASYSLKFTVHHLSGHFIFSHAMYMVSQVLCFNFKPTNTVHLVGMIEEGLEEDRRHNTRSQNRQFTQSMKWWWPVPITRLKRTGNPFHC